jgi:transcriptional regulator NrdR family protein
LRANLKVKKEKGPDEAFDPRKLRKSINIACERGQIDDAYLSVIVANGVSTALRKSHTEFVTTKEIKDEVFRQLDRLSTTIDRTNEEEFRNRANKLKQAWKQQKKIKDIDQTLRELSEVENELAKWKRAYIDREAEVKSLRQQAPPPAGLPPAFLPRNKDSRGRVIEAVLAAERDFSEFLIIHDNAKFTAKESPYQHGEKVYEALKCLADYVREKPQLDLKEWWSRHSALKYAPHESETVSQNPACIKDRTVAYNGTSVILENHLKLGNGKPDNCCRIYFENLLKDEGKLLIGYVGRHP